MIGDGCVGYWLRLLATDLLLTNSPSPRPSTPPSAAHHRARRLQRRALRQWGHKWLRLLRGKDKERGRRARRRFFRVEARKALVQWRRAAQVRAARRAAAQRREAVGRRWHVGRMVVRWRWWAAERAASRAHWRGVEAMYVRFIVSCSDAGQSGMRCDLTLTVPPKSQT